MNAVAITGANGFIGQHLVRRFRDGGWDVRPVLRQDLDAGPLEALFDGAAVVIHAAGATRAPNEAELQRSNAALTARVISAARRADVARFILLSSQAAAGPAASRDAPVTEDTTPAPQEAYGRSKLAAEHLVHAADLPWVIVRPAAVYGPGDRDFLAMFRLARLGVAVHPGNRDQWLSIVHVDDVARGIEIAATDPRAIAKTFFFANDEPAQWRQLFQMAADCAARKLRFDVELPKGLVRAGAMIGDVVARATGHASLLTTTKVALTRSSYWICSIERATRELGFAPRVRLHQGLCETYHWYRTQHWL